MSPAGVLMPLPVLIPLTAAALTLIAGRRPRLQRLITVVALGAVLAVCGVLVYLTDRDGTQALHVGGWGPTGAGLGPLGITLVADRLSALMLVGQRKLSSLLRSTRAASVPEAENSVRSARCSSQASSLAKRACSATVMDSSRPRLSNSKMCTSRMLASGASARTLTANCV